MEVDLSTVRKVSNCVVIGSHRQKSGGREEKKTVSLLHLHIQYGIIRCGNIYVLLLTVHIVRVV